MCLKLNVPSPARRPPSGSISCLWTSLLRCRSSSDAVGAARELEDRPAGEGAPDDGASLDDRALARVEPVEARRQQRVDRRRHGEGGDLTDGRDARLVALDVALVDEHAHELLDEQRVALGAGEDAVGQVGSDARVADEVLHQHAALVGAERLELDALGVRRGGGEVGSRVEQVVAGHGDDQHGQPRDRRGQVLDQVEQGRLGPVDVLEQDDQRLARGDGLEQAAHGPEGLGGVGHGVGQPERPRHSLDDRPVSSSAGSSFSIPAWASSALAPSSVPVSSATMSRSGQKVRPSP